jgi:hypothetical protein
MHKMSGGLMTFIVGALVVIFVLVFLPSINTWVGVATTNSTSPTVTGFAPLVVIGFIVAGVVAIRAYSNRDK